MAKRIKMGVRMAIDSLTPLKFIIISPNTRKEIKKKFVFMELNGQITED